MHGARMLVGMFCKCFSADNLDISEQFAWYREETLRSETVDQFVFLKSFVPIQAR
jgi:hypothetical protein